MSLLRPDRFVDSATGLDPVLLAERGVRAVLIDVDNTIVTRNDHVAGPGLREWAVSVRDAGLGGCLVSNNWGGRLESLALSLGFEVVPRALKPLPFAFRKACRALDVAPRECVVVGDQVFTDVLGGNLVGATTILVEPLAGSDLPHTVLLRRLEARIMAGTPLERTGATGSGEGSTPA